MGDKQITKIFFTGSHGTGKALPDDELIWSNKGLVKISSLNVGDKVVGVNGKYTTVVGVYPQPTPEPCYELTFRGGAKVRCSENHLWTYKNRSGRTPPFKTETLKAMLDRGLVYTRPTKDKFGRYRKKYRYALPSIDPVEFCTKEYSIDPYTLGVLIGDGCCRQKYLDSRIEGWKYKKQSKYNFTYSMLYPDGTHVKNSNYLAGLYSHQKYILDEYLEGSVDQRLSLLQGLMDTDGSIVQRKDRNTCTFSYSTTSSKLVSNILQLVRSLGMYANVSEDRRESRRICYNIIINIPVQLQEKVFRASYKKEKVKFTGKCSSICITDAKYIGELQCTCIKVSNEDGLFLTRDFIPTHNTTQVKYFLGQVNDSHPKFSMLDMERRDLHEKGIINLNKRVFPWDETVIAGNFMLALLKSSAPFISDRSWIDKCAYSQCCDFDDELKEAWHIINTRSFLGLGENEHYFYFPPILPLEDDGVRSISIEYQKEVDYWIQFYLDYFDIPYHTLESRTIQDRHLEIMEKVFGRI